MKDVMRILLVLMASMFFSTKIYSQVKEMGIEFGYGKTIIDDYGINFVSPFSKDLSKFYQVGWGFYYTPKNAVFTLKTGLNYAYKGQNNTGLDFFRVPASLDFKIGRKLAFIFGGGLYLSYLMAYSSNITHSDFKNSLHRFQLGCLANTGFGYQISTKYNLSLRFQHDFDITKLYENQKYSPGGLQYMENVKGYDGFISVCLKYQLNKE